MAGIDDNVAIIGEWMPPSPSPRALFSSILGDICGSRPILELSNGSRTEDLLGHRKQIVSGNNSVKDVSQGCDSGNQVTDLSSFSEQKSNLRSGLSERIAARAGFNAPRLNTESIKSPDLSLTSDLPSPYLTIPPDLSPTTLLDSPVFLSNSLAQPSPTTGKFPFILNGSSRSSTLMFEAADKKKEKNFKDIGASAFAFKPNVESSSCFFSGAANKMTSATFSQQSFPTIEASAQSGNTSQNLGPTKFQSHNPNTLQLQPGFSNSSVGRDNRDNDKIGCSVEHSPPFEEKMDKGDQRGSEDSLAGGAGGTTSEDGYNWRKYGQKQVKGSEYPRSYYKCTHPNCPVTKKVERSHEGHITEIIYKGAHNHPKPPPNRRSAIGSSNSIIDRRLEATSKQAGPQFGTDGDPFWASTHKGSVSVAPDWRHDNLDVTSSVSVGPEYCNRSASLQGQNGTHVESGDIVDASSTLSNDEEDDDRGTHGSVSLGYDGEGDESESKRRRIEAYAAEMTGASRAIREPRVVVQTTSEVDILDDGYRWRKYGQKVVKGNPNPRSYYKCTNPGCTVRKHVERASHDLKSVITTYEGKHNHDVPAARNNSHVNSGVSSNIASVGQPSSASVQANIHRPEPSQMHNGMGRFERLASLSSFGLPGRNQMGPSHSLSYGMNQPGLANLAMAGLGPGQQKFPVHPYLTQTQQHQLNDMSFMLPKGEPKVEPVSEIGLSLSNGSVYQQFMSGLPLGPQM